MQEVFYDLRAFTVVLITVLLIYSTTFSILSNLSNDANNPTVSWTFYMFLSHEFRFMLGDLSDPFPYDTNDKVILYFVTGISLCVIMLNLIVALLSNTYCKVMATEKEIS